MSPCGHGGQWLRPTDQPTKASVEPQEALPRGPSSNVGTGVILFLQITASLTRYPLEHLCLP